MSIFRITLLTVAAMLAFAGNSLLCRLALKETTLDAASFTLIRLLAGAVTLGLWLQFDRTSRARRGDWLAACALLIYAAGFSFAYIELSAATGALVLFGAVQLTMIAYGISRGERFKQTQWLGLLLAFAGLIGLLLPGIAAPPLVASLLMLTAGIAWGVYSLRGRGADAPLPLTAGNFLRASLIAIVGYALYGWVQPTSFVWDSTGAWYALAAGALTSGLGYAIWYAVLPALRASSAATIQLSVPAIAALGGVLLLAEPLTLRLVVASVVILGGIALVIRK